MSNGFLNFVSRHRTRELLSAKALITEPSAPERNCGAVASGVPTLCPAL
jgi:hypothetical protein